MRQRLRKGEEGLFSILRGTFTAASEYRSHCICHIRTMAAAKRCQRSQRADVYVHLRSRIVRAAGGFCLSMWCATSARSSLCYSCRCHSQTCIVHVLSPMPDLVGCRATATTETETTAVVYQAENAWRRERTESVTYTEPTSRDRKAAWKDRT
jgi:hypothetical protein